MELPPLGPGNFLRAVRTFRGWSRTEYARRTGIDPSRLALIEGGVAVPTMQELEQLWDSLSSADFSLSAHGSGRPAARRRSAGDAR